VSHPLSTWSAQWDVERYNYLATIISDVVSVLYKGGGFDLRGGEGGKDAAVRMRRRRRTTLCILRIYII
jgi:hypothetical protein